MIGKIRNDQIESSTMIHNSAAILNETAPKPDEIDFTWNRSPDGSHGALFTPPTDRAEEGDYYWLGDGFVHPSPDKLYLFSYRVRNSGDGPFGFSFVDNPILVVSNPSPSSLTDYRVIDTPFYKNEPENGSFRSFGAGVFVNTKWAGAPHPDGYVYVYGIRGSDKQVIVARVRPKHVHQINHWRYWNGDEWTPNINSCATIARQASNELSVTSIGNGTYALIFQVDGFTGKTGMRLGKHPWGPFGDIEVIWHAPESRQENFYTYNAKAHPHLSPAGKLLISYNVNSFDFLKDLDKHPKFYRPRFIWLKFSE